MYIPKLADIDFGEIDANVEYYRSLKQETVPVYKRAFVKPPLSYWSEFINGDRFIISGQKGTGKTALLRILEGEVSESHCSTDFLEFKDEVIEESDLYDGVFSGAIDTKNLNDSAHYLHILKRIMILKLLALGLKEISNEAVERLDDGMLQKLVSKIRKSTAGDLVQLAFSSVYDVAVGLEKKDLKIKADFVRLIKSQNDTLLKFYISQAQKNSFSARLFIDEVHFSFKDEGTLKKDAMLVRDCLNAAININQTFIKNKLDCVVYVAVRSEFLEHPIIAQAELYKQAMSYGEELSWAAYPNDRNHPLWDVAFKRILESSPNLTKVQFLDAYLPGESQVEVIKHSWVKPRDIVRYFNCAKRMYGSRTSLSSREVKAVLREYCKQSWGEVRTSVSSVLDTDGIAILEEFLGDNAERQYSRREPLTKKELHELIVRAVKNDAIDPSFVAKMLYVMGILVMEQRDQYGQKIFNSYHRNNLQPKWAWDIFFHQAVARRFS